MPRPASHERLARILVMVPWVIAHPDEATVDAVCEQFGIDRATLAADLETLFLCGLPPFQPGDLIEAWIDGDHVYIGMADYLARPLRLTRLEALMVLAAGRALAGTPGLGEGASLRSALDKVASAIAPDEVAGATLLAERVAIELEPPAPEVLEALHAAIGERRTVRMEYYTLGRDDLTVREADPLLVFGSKPWYLVAIDRASGIQKTFRIDRIRSVEILDKTFERPPGFDPRREAGAPLYHPSPGDVTVVLDLAPAAEWIAEQTPIEGNPVRTGDRTRITLRTGRTAWLERLLLQHGDHVRVVEPAELRDRVAALARQALARYA